MSAPIIIESIESGETTTGPNQSTILRYRVFRHGGDLPSRDEALDLVLSAAPDTFDEKPIREVRVSPDGGAWTAEVTYAIPDAGGGAPPPQTGESTFSFVVSGGTARIQYSLETISRIPAAGQQSAPDHRGAIGVGSDGKVEGVDIIVPEAAIEIRLYRDESFFSSTYRRRLMDTVGKVNSNNYLGASPGELLFAGVTLTRRARDVEATYRFLVSPNRTGIVIANSGITVPVKEGWDYLWTHAGRVVINENTGEGAVRIIAAYVERVYERADFSLLEIE